MYIILAYTFMRTSVLKPDTLQQIRVGANIKCGFSVSGFVWTWPQFGQNLDRCIQALKRGKNV